MIGRMYTGASGLGDWDFGFRISDFGFWIGDFEWEGVSRCWQGLAGFIVQKWTRKSRPKMQGVDVKGFTSRNRPVRAGFAAIAAGVSAVGQRAQRLPGKRVTTSRRRSGSFAAGEALVEKLLRRVGVALKLSPTHDLRPDQRGQSRVFVLKTGRVERVACQPVLACAYDAHRRASRQWRQAIRNRRGKLGFAAIAGGDSVDLRASSPRDSRSSPWTRSATRHQTRRKE